MTRGRQLAVGAAFALVASGCWTTVRPRAPVLPPEETPPAPPPAPVVVAPAPEKPAVGVEEIPHPRLGTPEVMFTEVEGVPVAQVVHYFDVTERIEACEGVHGESIEIVMVAEDGKLKATLQDTTASESVTGCVLNALAQDTQDLTEILAPSGTPSDRPQRVKSLLTIRFGD